MIYFTADHHFGHANIIRPEFCGSTRPFKTIEEHDAALIEVHNDIVTDEDTVWFLGDVSLKADAGIAALEQMNGIKHLIVGNHDRPKLQNWSGWTSRWTVMNLAEACLQHVPTTRWTGVKLGKPLLHGHTHGRPVNIPNTFDVGVDCWGLRPVTLGEILMGGQHDSS